MIRYSEKSDMDKKDNMKKLTIINMYGNIYWPKNNEKYKNASNIKYVIMPQFRSDDCLYRIVKELGFTCKYNKNPIDTGLTDDIVEFDNMRLIWPLPCRSNIVPKELNRFNLVKEHMDYVNEIAAFHANAIFDFVEDDNIVVIDVSNMDYTYNDTYFQICSKCYQILRQRYKKIYVVYIGTVTTLLRPKRGLVIDNGVRSYFSDCIIDWSISEILCREKQHIRSIPELIEMASEIHSIKFHEIVEQILSEQILLREEKK